MSEGGAESATVLWFGSKLGAVVKPRLWDDGIPHPFGAFMDGIMCIQLSVAGWYSLYPALITCTNLQVGTHTNTEMALSIPKMLREWLCWIG